MKIGMSQAMKRVNSSSPEETFRQGVIIGKSLSSPCVIALKGDLGAGKTTLIKGIVHGFSGIDPRNVSSPTFTYLNIYAGSPPIYHFDLYRLRSAKDFLALGFDEYFEQEGICLIEWPELILDLFEQKMLQFEIKYISENARELILREKVTR